MPPYRTRGIERIDSFTSISIRVALRRIEMRFKVRLQSVWTDAFCSLKEDSLGPHLSQGQELVWGSIGESLENVTFHTNVAYTKCQSYVERKVGDVKALLRQCQLPAGGQPKLLGEEGNTLILSVEVNLNNTPYNCNSLATPESLINPLILAKQLVVQDSKLSPNTNHFHQVAEALQDIRHEQLLQGDKLQRSATNCREPEVGQTIFFLKNPDNKRAGILF